MIRSIYTGASGMLAKWTEMDVIANNLANVDTPGFKQHLTLFKEEPRFKMYRLFDEFVDTPAGKVDMRPGIGEMGTGVRIKGEHIDFDTKAPLKATGNVLDLAIHGEGFFEVDRPDKGKFYTRAGNFLLNDFAEIVTPHGDRVLGVDGNPIKISGTSILVQKDGSIVNNDGVALGQLQLVTFENMQKLHKTGDNLYATTETSGQAKPAPAQSEIHQGFLEQSNANVIDSMVRMIVVQRAYETNQRVITSSDSLLGKAVSELGQV